jgi:hypothetical protein
MRPFTHIAVATEAKTLVANGDCPALLASVEMLCPITELTVNTPMHVWRKYSQILRSIIERVTVFVMNYASIWDCSKNVMMFKDPTRFGLTKGIVISVFASSDSHRANRIFFWPSFTIFSSPLCSTLRRASNTAKRSITFKNLSTNWTTTEVLSHATE